MWRVILLVYCYHVVSQPVTDEPQTRHTRELIECCPCPGSTHGGPDTLGRSLSRSVEDCPCRSADSEGASSMFSPTRTPGNPISSVPFMRSNDPNDMKNLLEPEVGLATSMLQTLREATEEEYRDALARDAMRSADAFPEESARNVVIIVKPRASDDADDFISEASNVKETRCVNSVGSPLKTASKPLRTLPDFFRLPKAKQSNFMPRNSWDMDNNQGASNLQEKVLGTDGEVAELKSRSPLFKLRTPLKENLLKSSNVGDVLKTSSVFDKFEHTWKNRPNLFERFNLPLIPKMNVDNPLRKDTDVNRDLKPAPSNIQELIDKEGKGKFKLNNRPLMFKNLLKLKDVELVPKTIPRIPVFNSKLNSNDVTFTSLNRDVDGNIECEDTTNDSNMNDKMLIPITNSNNVNENFEEKNEDLAPQNVAGSVFMLEEDHLDAITSPSEMIPNILDNTQPNIVIADKSDCNNLSSEEIMPTMADNISNGVEDGELNDVLEPPVESEIQEISENVDSNASKSCETIEILEKSVESLDSDTDTTNLENVVPLDSRERSISPPQIQEPERVTTILSDNGNEDFTSNQNIPDQTQSTVPKSEEPRKKIIHSVKPIPPLSATMSAIKDNARKSIENLKKTENMNSVPPENSGSSLKTDTPITIIQDLNQEPRNDELIQEQNNSTEKEEILRVTFNDLQKLSDDLLVLSSNKEQNLASKEAAKNEARVVDVTSNEVRGGFDNIETDSVTEPTDKTEVIIPKETDLKFPKGKACRVVLDTNKTNQKSAQEFESIIPNEDKKDMSVEASAPIATTLPGLLDPLNSLNLNEQLGASLLKLNPLDPLNLNDKLGSALLPNLDPLNLNEKLGSAILDPLNLSQTIESFIQPNLDPLNVRSSIQNIIMQPTFPDNPLKFLGKPVAEVLKLPTLEDLRERLSSVFDNNDRSAENNFSDEDGDYTNVAPVEMASAASTTSSQKVTSIRPLENMNVDFLQLNSLSKPNILSSAPRPNLNTFRTKLPIPNNLDLKPIKLESTNKGNVLGTTFTFGNDKATLRKPKPNHSSLLGRPIGALPSLDELRNSLQSGTNSLLGTPLQPNLDLFRDSSLRASGIPDIDEIRRNAEKTMKGLHQRMKSTFKSGNINPLSEKFGKPQDLLDDVNDKLKAIHYDFNDRLSSIHEDIFDQSRLKDLTNPILSSFPTNRNANTNIMNNIRNRGKPARLQASASVISSQEVVPHDNTNDRTLLRLPARSSPRRIKVQHKFLGAESAPEATKVEFPTTKTTPSKLMQPIPSLSQRLGNAFPQNIRDKALELPGPGFAKDLKRPILSKTSPFKDKNGKVTITFATTTASPVTSPMSQFRTTPSVDKQITNFKHNSDSLKERLAQHKPNIFGDGRQSASELKPSRILHPGTSKNNFKTADSDMKIPHLKNLDSIENMQTKLSSYKGDKDFKLRLNENNANKLNSARAFDNKKPEGENPGVSGDKTRAKPLVWPKSGEESFLTKVREAMQARLNNFHPAKAAEKVDKVESSKTDMLRSASENNVIEKPLKENVSYKCKMVCTKE